MILFDHASIGGLSLFYFFHISLSCIVASISTYFLARRYKDYWLYSFGLLVFFNIALPIVGYLFSIWLTYYLFHVKYEKVLKNTKLINMDELDQEFPHVKRAFGEGSMVDLMADTLAPQELRMKALSAMAENMTQKNVSVIKKSLSEKDDEIRLYSFSLIDNMEHGLNSKIHEATLRFKNEENKEEHLKATKELAFLYWEMIYFDLSDEVLKNYLINTSYDYAKLYSKADMSDVDIHVLLGKIYLSKHQYENATTQFVMAIESGVDNSYIIPYLAELYFKRGNYKSIRSMLSVEDKLDMNATMHPVVGQWKKYA